MITEILGILIGFCTSMLIFSLLVTSIVQFISEMLNDRERNLTKGLHLLENKLDLSSENQTSNWTSWFGIVPFTYTSSLMESIKQKSINKKLTYISFKQFSRAYTERFNNLSDEGQILVEYKENDLREHYNDLSAFLTEQFKKRKHRISFFISAIVVIIFQLNTFELLEKLSLNEDFRNNLIKHSQSISSESLEQYKQKDFEQLNREVNTQLISIYSTGYSEKLEQLSSINNNNNKDALTDFDNIFQGDSSVLHIRSDYVDLLQNAKKLEHSKVKEQMNDRLAALSEYDFKIMPNGYSYYRSSDPSTFRDNWIGMFASMILISLGAPFWFNLLRNIVGLKDTLANTLKEKEDNKDNK